MIFLNWPHVFGLCKDCVLKIVELFILKPSLSDTLSVLVMEDFADKVAMGSEARICAQKARELNYVLEWQLLS